MFFEGRDERVRRVAGYEEGVVRGDQGKHSGQGHFGGFLSGGEVVDRSWRRCGSGVVRVDGLEAVVSTLMS